MHSLNTNSHFLNCQRKECRKLCITSISTFYLLSCSPVEDPSHCSCWQCSVSQCCPVLWGQRQHWQTSARTVCTQPPETQHKKLNIYSTKHSPTLILLNTTIQAKHTIFSIVLLLLPLCGFHLNQFSLLKTFFFH